MCVVYVSDSEELLPKSSRCLYIFFFCITDPLHSTLQCYCVQRAIFKMKKKKKKSVPCPKMERNSPLDSLPSSSCNFSFWRLRKIVVFAIISYFLRRSFGIDNNVRMFHLIGMHSGQFLKSNLAQYKLVCLMRNEIAFLINLRFFDGNLPSMK